MRTRKIPLILLAVILLSSAYLLMDVQMGSGSPLADPMLSFGETLILLPENQPALVELTLTDISDVWGIDVTISYPIELITITQTALTPGECPAPHFIVANEIDPLTGTIQYAVVQVNQSINPSCNGGQVASFEVECNGSQTGDIQITTSNISQPDGKKITHSTQPLEIHCLANQMYLPVILTP